MSSKILVTGALGFVGSAVVNELLRRGHSVRASSRHAGPSGDDRLERVGMGEMSAVTDWRDVTGGIDAVVHCAARVHVMRENVTNPLEAFRSVNVAGTLQLARKCAEAGVRRFIFISSIKVNGEETVDGCQFSEIDAPFPQDAYGISKHEAECGLKSLAEQTGMEVVIIRPPLIYGPGVKANFAALVQAVRRGLPLPLGAINNRRSLVGIDNLVDFIILCLFHPAAGNETFLVSDGLDLSTPELIIELSRATGVAPRLFAVPLWMLRAVARAVGKSAALARLGSSLQIDSGKARGLLGWRAPITVSEGFRRAVAVATR